MKLLTFINKTCEIIHCNKRNSLIESLENYAILFPKHFKNIVDAVLK